MTHTFKDLERVNLAIKNMIDDLDTKAGEGLGVIVVVMPALAPINETTGISVLANTTNKEHMLLLLELAAMRLNRLLERNEGMN